MKVLVLQHLAVEHPGVFRDFMREDGVAWTTVQLDEGDPIPDLAPFDVMMVMGGPQNTWQEDRFPWLKTEKAAIRRFVVDMQRPYLGICLGHQLLADALGGEVRPGPKPEVGALSISKTDAGQRDPLLKGLSDPLAVLQWHGAEVKRLPDGAELLASSDVCDVQVFRYGARAYGLQCHIEVTGETVPEWAAVPEYAQALDVTLGPGSMGRLKDEVAGLLPAYTATARAMYQNFKALI